MFKVLSATKFFIVIMIYFVLLLGITIWSSTADAPIDISSPHALLFLKIVQAISVLVVFIFPACAFVLFFTSEKMNYFQLNKLPSLFFALISCLLIVCSLPFISYLESLNKMMSLPHAFSGIEQWMKSSELKVQQIEEAFIKDRSLMGLYTNIFVIGFMAALSEELFFRGLIQRALVNASKNVHLSVWITAILFSAFHMQFYGFLPRMLLGAILGYLFVWSGSLWTTIIVHFLNNTAVVIISYLLGSGILPPSVEQMGMESDKVTLAWALPSFALTLIGIFLLNRIKRSTILS
ncbi:MAG: CPBP family intramembrane metalloprotease [Bacteroidia bacterium]|nr:CPBP family intramembrane metalloprotease [Bacteroidia bacterium]